MTISRLPIFLLFFFFNDTATTEIYTLSLHDALPILIRDAHGAEQVLLLERGQLLRALEQKVELGRQGRRARVAVEALEKRILRPLLQHALGREAGAQTASEARLADADRPFDHDELVRSFA